MGGTVGCVVGTVGWVVDVVGIVVGWVVGAVVGVVVLEEDGVLAKLWSSSGTTWHAVSKHSSTSTMDKLFFIYIPPFIFLPLL